MRDDGIDLLNGDLEHEVDECLLGWIDWIVIHNCTCVRGGYPNASTKVQQKY